MVASRSLRPVLISVTLEGMRSPLDPASAEELKSLYLSGLSCPDIAVRYDVSADTIRSALKRGGVPIRGRGKDRGKKTFGGVLHPAYKGERRVYKGYVWLY